MRDDKLVSVIVPVYNVESYLYRCVASLTSQSYNNIEIILIDDGSTDSSGDMCDKLVQTDSRIVVIHKTNGGLSSARNEGIAKSKGEYITFVDSDDFVLPDYVKTLLNLCLTNGTPMSGCCTTNVYDNGENSKGYYILRDKVLNYEEFINTGFDAAWAKLYQRNLFNNIRFPLNKKHEDHYIYAKIAYEAKRISTTSQQLYMYYKGRKTCLTQSTKFTFESEEAFLETMEFISTKHICTWLLNSTMVQLAYSMFKKKLHFRKVSQSAYKEFKKLYFNLYKKIKTQLSQRSRLKIRFRFIFFPIHYFKQKLIS